MGRVHLLSDELINKIAAGEVVERPASVVKELVENSVDAGARSVRVLLTGGGLSSITVIDDGYGMSADDARLSLERHATSKLADEAGLFEIATKGFRGEALPSIASVSRFTLATSEPNAPEGLRLSLEGGGRLQLEPCAPLGGTRIDVVDLFFNTPARRKFLKRDATELSHCEEAVIRVALAHPDVAFFVEHEGRRLFTAPVTTDEPKERVAAALGPEITPHLLAIDERRLGVTVSGFVASPELTLPTARGLYTYINHRYVRDRGLTAAVQRAYQDSLPPGRQPVAVVLIEIDARAVDVNVHPQKLEVRFSDPRSVQEAVGAAITRALKAAPWRTEAATSGAAEQGAHYAMAVERFLARAQAAPAFLEPPPDFSLDGANARPAFGTRNATLHDSPPPGYFSALRFIGDWGRRYWLCEGPQGSLVVIDPRAAHERLVLQRLLARLRAPATSSAAPPSLFARQVELGSAAAAVIAAAPALARLGVEVEPFGGSTVALKAVPPDLEQVDHHALLVALAEALAGEGPPDARTALALMAAAAARDAPARTVTHAEAQAVLSELDDTDFDVPGPRVVVHEVPLLSLG